MRGLMKLKKYLTFFNYYVTYCLKNFNYSDFLGERVEVIIVLIFIYILKSYFLSNISKVILKKKKN